MLSGVYDGEGQGIMIPIVLISSSLKIPSSFDRRSEWVCEYIEKNYKKQNEWMSPLLYRTNDLRWYEFRIPHIAGSMTSNFKN